MDPMQIVIALAFLTAMEIVLGIDNIVFIAILCSRLPVDQQRLGRRWGLAAALVTRLMLLGLLYWMLSPDSLFKFELLILTEIGFPESWLTNDAGKLAHEVNEFTVQDLVLLAGGLFLIGKSVHEVHDAFEGGTKKESSKKPATFGSVLAQVALLDIVFSLDSVITAVGMAKSFYVMATAIVLAVAVMLLCADAISKFIDDNPTVKMLALSFLILIGVMLTSEAMGMSIKKGYIYFAMAFALFVEFLNLRLRARRNTAATSESE